MYLDWPTLNFLSLFSLFQWFSTMTTLLQCKDHKTNRNIRKTWYFKPPQMTFPKVKPIELKRMKSRMIHWFNLGYDIWQQENV